MLQVNDLVELNPLYVDVDGTILFWPAPNQGHHQSGTEPVVNEDLMIVLKHYKQSRPNSKLIAWSANGEEYARRWLTYCGIVDVFDLVLGKPQGFVDDTFDWLMIRPKFLVRQGVHGPYYLRSQ